MILRSPLGDCCIHIKALYALSVLYPKSQIIVFTSKMGERLYQDYHFLHKIITIDDSNNRKWNLLEALSNHKINILIAHRAFWAVETLKQSGIPKVIMELCRYNALSRQFLSPFYYKRYYVHASEQILRLVRRINPSHYDKNISQIDFSQSKLQTSKMNQENIKTFLESCGGGGQIL